LTQLNDRKRNIMTVEDPIEYYLDGISQTQVNTKVEMTFARGLRAILRQDPDVVMVGEIRDLETAEIAVQASLTGHLVLSTLHTNSAVGAITRLRDMGVEPFLLSSSLVGVLAQRLVRKLCPNCKQPHVATPADCDVLGVDPAVLPTLYVTGRLRPVQPDRIPGSHRHFRAGGAGRGDANPDSRRQRRTGSGAPRPTSPVPAFATTAAGGCWPAIPRWRSWCE
jgi:hypothetical protein